MQSRRAWRLRKAVDQLESFVAGADRFVDMGVVLHVVDRDPFGEGLVPGAPKLRILDTYRFGGLLDRRLRAFVAPSMQPVVWYCSQHQLPLILHGDDVPDRVVARGAMGAGKTQVLAMRLILRAFFLTGFVCALGATAPTAPRLAMIREALGQKMPADWYRWSERRSEYTLAMGIRVQLVSTHQQSHAGGSPIQGYNWADCSSDEMQDSLAVDSDIEARGRSAPYGRYKRFCSVTSKDSPDYRSWIDFIKTSGEWGIFQLKGPDNPFTEESYWEKLSRTMNPREYARKVGAEDVGPERQLYNTWDRSLNVRPVPQIGATDVTAHELARWGKNFTMLVGHDPGKMWQVSIFLRAYRLPGEMEPTWWVVDEVSSRRATTEDHIAAVLERLRGRWHCNHSQRVGRSVDGGGRALVRADPYSDSGNDERSPDRSVYTQFKGNGLAILPANYVANTNKVKVRRVPKDAGIEMIVTLICNKDGQRRLLVANDERGQPVAPRLVESLETSERDGDGRAEMEKKDERDRSHWAACLRYALWQIEKPRFDRMRKRVA